MESHRQTFNFLSIKNRIVYSKMFFYVEDVERSWQGWRGVVFNIFLHQFTYDTTIFKNSHCLLMILFSYMGD